MGDEAAGVRKKASARGRRSSGFGARVRRFRRESELTLQQLADRTGLAVSTLSKVENEQISPTYENIVRLAEGLAIDVAELFNAHPKPMASGRLSVTRAGMGVRHRTGQYEYEILCSELSHKRFMPLTAVIKARSAEEFPVRPSHAGEEFVHVLSGEVTIHTEHYGPITLSPGDSCYFDSRMEHVLITAGQQDATVLWVCSHLDLPFAPTSDPG
jgi:transcriptional regulator with XRE-family HTH domain